MQNFISQKQRDLFKAIENSGKLIFACGPTGISANLVGVFVVRKNHHGNDQLDVGDGTHHVHIDWSLLKRFTVAEYHEEGVMTFFNDEKPMFKLYRMDGPFSEKIMSLAGCLID